MSRLRVSTLMLLVMIAALCLGWFVMEEEHRLKEAVEEGNRLQWATTEWYENNEQKVKDFKKYGNRRHECE